jgi:O-antigen/teichoic acid export membrane protein
MVKRNLAMRVKKLKITIQQWLSSGYLQKIFDILKDPLSKTAVIILSTWCMNATAGFIFILIAAKMYSIESVGVATLLISYAGFIMLITRFGIEQSMVRYYDENRKSSIYCSALFLTTISATIVGVLLIVLSYFEFFNSGFLFSYADVFLLSLIIISVGGISGIFFLSSGKPILFFLQNAIISSRFIILFILVPFGIMGIFCSLVVATAISVIFSILLILHSGVKFQFPEKNFFRDSFYYSFGNYISDCFLMAPVFLIPMIVFYYLGESNTAIYSVSYAFASIAFLIPTAIGYSIFLSGCQDGRLLSSMKPVIGAALILLTGIIITFIFWGKDIMHILGPDYAGSANLIFIIMSSSIFALFFQIYSAEFKILQQMRKLLIFNGIFFVTLMIMSYVFVLNLGLIGTGYAWIGAYAVCVIPLGCYSLYKQKYFIPSSN